MATKQDGFYCSTSGTYFSDKESLAEHYKSDFHRYNLKRKVHTSGLSGSQSGSMQQHCQQQPVRVNMHAASRRLACAAVCNVTVQSLYRSTAGPCIVCMYI